MTDINQKISKADLAFIRTLKDFDLIMLISEVHDHGWPMAQRTLDMIRTAYAKGGWNKDDQPTRRAP